MKINQKIIRILGYLTFGICFLIIGVMSTELLHKIPQSVDVFSKVVVFISIIISYFYLESSFSQLDDNDGFYTPKQIRFKLGDKVKITQHKTEANKFEVGQELIVVETARYDYLVSDENGKLGIVYQFEIVKI